MIKGHHSHGFASDDAEVVDPVGRLAPDGGLADGAARIEHVVVGRAQIRIEPDGEGAFLGVSENDGVRSGGDDVLAINNISPLIPTKRVGLDLFAEHAVVRILERKPRTYDA